MFKCETHIHKWGKVQEMESNDSQVHSHFGSCTCVGVQNLIPFFFRYFTLGPTFGSLKKFGGALIVIFLGCNKLWCS